jgi:hypothetical protein
MTNFFLIDEIFHFDEFFRFFAFFRFGEFFRFHVLRFDEIKLMIFFRFDKYLNLFFEDFFQFDEFFSI